MRLTNPWPSNSRSNWNLEMLIFVEGGKPENPEKTLGARTRTKNKPNPLMTPGPGFEPGAGPHWWEASAITTAPSLLPLNLKIKLNKDKLKGTVHRCATLKIERKQRAFSLRFLSVALSVTFNWFSTKETTFCRKASNFAYFSSNKYQPFRLAYLNKGHLYVKVAR